MIIDVPRTYLTQSCVDLVARARLLESGDLNSSSALLVPEDYRHYLAQKAPNKE